MLYYLEVTRCIRKQMVQAFRNLKSRCLIRNKEIWRLRWGQKLSPKLILLVHSWALKPLSVSVRPEESLRYSQSSYPSLTWVAPNKSLITSVTADQPRAWSPQVHRELRYQRWRAALPCSSGKLESKEFRRDIYKDVIHKSFEKVKSPSGNIKQGSSQCCFL